MAKRKSSKKSKYSPTARRAASQAIRHHMKDKHMPQDQAVAVALSEQRRRGRKVPSRGSRRTGHPTKRGSRKAASAASRAAGRKSRGGRRKGATTRSRAAQKAGKASARRRKSS